MSPYILPAHPRSGQQVDRNIPKPNMPKMMKSLLLFSLHLCLQLTTSATASVVLGGQNQSIQERLRTTDWAAKKQLEEKIEQSNIFSSTEAEEIIEQSNLFSSPKAEQSAAATFSDCSAFGEEKRLDCSIIRAVRSSHFFGNKGNCRRGEDEDGTRSRRACRDHFYGR